MEECPKPTVTISNFRIVNGVASADISYDLKGHKPTVGTTFYYYNGAQWDNIKFLSEFGCLIEDAVQPVHYEWNMVQHGDCVIAVRIVLDCGAQGGPGDSGWTQLELIWARTNIVYDPVLHAAVESCSQWFFAEDENGDYPTDVSPRLCGCYEDSTYCAIDESIPATGLQVWMNASGHYTARPKPDDLDNWIPPDPEDMPSGCLLTDITFVWTEKKGKIVEVDVPASVEQGASFDIQAKTKNNRDTTATFKMQLLINDTVVSTSDQFDLAAGATSEDKIPPANAPTTGTSMTYEIKCIRIT